jgi:hypothetical protein
VQEDGRRGEEGGGSADVRREGGKEGKAESLEDPGRAEEEKERRMLGDGEERMR